MNGIFSLITFSLFFLLCTSETYANRQLSVLEFTLTEPEYKLEVVLMTIGDEYDFTVYEHGKTYSADTGGEPSFYDWIMAQSDGELPGESYDLPIWYKTYEKDLDAAKAALNFAN